jgi:hypothetical protein
MFQMKDFHFYTVASFANGYQNENVMKKFGIELETIINQLCAQMRERYPNLYYSMSERYIYETLEDLYRDSEKRMLQKRYKATYALNRMRRAVKVQIQ